MNSALSDLEIIQNNLAKAYARQGAYLVKVKIGNNWVTKCFIKKCPRCDKKLPKGLSARGIEACTTPRCGYKRRVYTLEEWESLIYR